MYNEACIMLPLSYNQWHFKGYYIDILYPTCQLLSLQCTGLVFSTQVLHHCYSQHILESEMLNQMMSGYNSRDAPSM